MNEKGGKNKGVYLIIGSIFIILLITFVSAGWFDNIKSKLTGKATVSLNITVGGPTISLVLNNSITDYSSIGPNEAPNPTYVIINFSAYSVQGFDNFNHATASASFTKATEDTRVNSTCSLYASSGNYANYTCNVTMWWWDAEGTWNINVTVRDDQENIATNTSTTFQMGSSTTFTMSPPTLNWTSLSPGATNQTPTNDPLILNNTGNTIITPTNIQLNASNLRGETTSTEALWASNFSAFHGTGGSCTGADCIECAGTVMERNTLAALTTANLTKGNFTSNDGTAQEELYVCLRFVGNELSTQSYSTSNETEWPWVVAIS
jgi:hypothetical protein